MQQYDLVVIGSGPGGQRAAIQAAKAKKRVAVVEKQTMVGGVCINTGTIPSKTMREAVLHLSGFYDQAFYGANYHAKENITMNDLSFCVIGLNIINTVLPLTMPSVPKTLIVVGGGVIGVEYACMFATLGVRVIIVEKRPRLLEFADTEMVEALTYHMRDQRATLRLNEEVDSVEELPEGKVAANLVSKKRIIADGLLYAIGRQGNVDKLDLAAAGIESDDRGRIKVDADF